MVVDSGGEWLVDPHDEWMNDFDVYYIEQVELQESVVLKG